MLKNRLFSSAIVIAGGLFATTALANEGEKAGQTTMDHGSAPSFEEVDVNGDGYISEVELQDSGAYQADLSELDTDNDGRVDQTEFAAFEAKVMEQGQQQGAEEEYQTDPTEDLGETESDY